MKKDVADYYFAVQKQYNDLVATLDKINQEIKDGKITEEQKEQFQKYVESVSVNYQRISYIYYLMNLPPKWVQKLEQKKLKKEEEKIKRENTKAGVIEENQSVIDDMSSYITSEGDSEWTI